MNEIETYLNELNHELRELSEAERADIIAEIETHIESGLAEDDEKIQAKLFQELGSPQSLAAHFHRLNWKRNWVYFCLAAIPLFIMNTLASSLPYYLTTLGLPTSLTKLMTLLFCLLMLGISLRLKSSLLLGWWFGFTVIRFYDVLFLDAPFLSSVWPFTLLFFWIGLLWCYGRFLWQNRHDGFIITLTLIPYVWGAALIIIPGAVWIRNQFLYSALTSVIVGLSMTFTVLGAFIISSRKQRWQVMFFSTTLCAIPTLFIWHSSGNILFWGFLYLPILAGWLVENGSGLHRYYLQLQRSS